MEAEPQNALENISAAVAANQKELKGIAAKIGGRENELRLEKRFRYERWARFLIPLILVIGVWSISWGALCDTKLEPSKPDPAETAAKTANETVTLVEIVTRGVIVFGIMTAATCVSVAALKRDW